MTASRFLVFGALMLAVIDGGAARAEDATAAGVTPTTTISEFDQGVLCGSMIQHAVHASMNTDTLARHPDIGAAVSTTMRLEVDIDLVPIAFGWDTVQPWFAKLNDGYRQVFVHSMDQACANRTKCGIVNASPELEKKIQEVFVAVHQYGTATATAAAATP